MILQLIMWSSIVHASE